MVLANAIDLAYNLRVVKIAFETDRINLKNVMSSEIQPGPLGILLCDMKQSLGKCFIEVCVMYTSRGCSKAFDVLAALRVGVAHRDHVFWAMSYHNS
jgi:hypothetical protein